MAFYPFPQEVKQQKTAKRIMDEKFHNLCDLCWEALGIKESQGKHIAEHITEIRQERNFYLSQSNKHYQDVLKLLETYDALQSVTNELAGILSKNGELSLENHAIKQAMSANEVFSKVKDGYK